MNALKHSRAYLLCSMVVVLQPLRGGVAQQNSSQTAERNGPHDFDFNFGTWKTHRSRLQHPLTGSTTWVEYDGISVVRKVSNGSASLFELEVDGPASHIECVGLRLYNPQSHRWSLNWTTSALAP